MTDVQMALRDFVKGVVPETLVLAKVDYVIDDGPTCDVTDEQGNEIFYVRLQAQLLNGSGSFLLPKLGSWVAIARLRNSEEWVVVQVSEVDRIEVRSGSVLFKMNADGFVMNKSANVLATMMQDLLTALETLTVTCAAPGSPSTPPVNLAQFTALKTKFNELLKTT